MKRRFEPYVMFAVVLFLHAGAIGFMIWAPAPKTQELVLPTVQGILIPAPPAETVQMPSEQKTPPPVEPPPPEPKKPKPVPKKVQPKPKPLPKPVVEAPPSEKAITQEEVAPEETAPPPAHQVSTPTAKEDDTLGAPITPPREDANHLNNPKPGYPSLSRRLREEGTVILEVLILTDGSVGDVRIKESSGFKRLDDTAVKAVKQWKYTPARRGDEPIEFWYLQPLEFSLN